jgi:CHAT domain-containing protein/tetratricopeptide (TPR) repeat protein
MKNPPALFCYKFILIISLWSLVACNNNTKSTSSLKLATDLITAEQLKGRGSYDSAIIFFRKAIDQNLVSKQYPEWVRSVSGDIECLRTKGELDSALKIANEALSIAESRIDTTGDLYNILIHKKAMLLSDKRQFNESSALFHRNINIYLERSSTADTILALSYNGLGTIYLLQNQSEQALNEYQKAINIYEKTQHTKSSNYSSSLQNIGILYSMTGNYEKAEQFFLQALKVKQEVLKSNDPQLTSLYVNLGRFYQIIRSDLKAIEYMKLAENIYISQNQSNSINAGILFLNMGVVYIYTGDYEKAHSYLNKSLEIITAKAPDNVAELLNLYLNMGFIAEKKEDYTLAKEYYINGLSIGYKLPNSVKLLRGLANVSYKMKQKKEADIYYKKALEKSIEMFGKEHPETALTYLRYGDFLSDQGNKQALLYLNMSLEIYKKSFGPDNIDVSSAYFYIGNFYFRSKEYMKAINFFQLSLNAGFQGFTSKNASDNPNISIENLNSNLLDPITGKALAFLKLYEVDTTKTEFLKTSASTFNLSLKMIELLRSTYQDEDSKLFISENEKKTFSSALLTQVKLYQKTNNKEALNQALTIAEKGKSAVLLAHLRDKEAKNFGRIPENLKFEDASLKSEIYSYNKQIHDQKLTNNPDEAKIKSWNSRIFDLSRKQDELIKSIEKKYPAYFNLKYDNSVVSVEEIQKKLGSNQAIVEFALTDSVLYTFAITSNNQKLYEQVIDSSFFNNLQTLGEQLSGKDFNNYSLADYTKYVSLSYQLYRTLLLPVKSLTKGKDIIIIPDGELGYLSFDVLLTSMPDTSKQQYRNLPYLIRESALSYAPSATTFFDELNAKKDKSNGMILAYAPDYGPDNTVLDQKDQNGNALSKVLTNLTNTQDEINSLSEYFKVKAFQGDKATESSFKKNAAGYKVLHLAMHTLINNENALYSKLVFFKPKGDTTDDGMLNASELINMELHSDMAVLSACNTGSGKMRKGEGIMSLSRDFFYAGVPGIVMTAWAVEDRAGIKLMDYFYKYIAQGKSRNEALRLAKIDYLDNCDKLTSHPHYWAAYMNVGDIRPIEGLSKKINPYLLYFLSASMVLIIVLLIIRIRKNQGAKQS